MTACRKAFLSELFNVRSCRSKHDQFSQLLVCAQSSVASVAIAEWPLTTHKQVDNFLANLHMTMSKGRHGDVFRQICGAGVVAKQAEFNDYGKLALETVDALQESYKC